MQRHSHRFPGTLVFPAEVSPLLMTVSFGQLLPEKNMKRFKKMDLQVLTLKSQTILCCEDLCPVWTIQHIPFSGSVSSIFLLIP